MSNVLNEEKKQQVIALGRPGWPLRRIERELDLRAGGDDATARGGKTGQRGDHRPYFWRKTGQ